MVAFELFKCKLCGLEVRRKRLGQRYCSERCRNAAVQNRKRRKQSRSGDGQPHSSLASPQKGLRLSPHLEAVTHHLKSLTKPMACGHQKSYQHPPSAGGLAKSLRRPFVNLTGRELPPELVRRIFATETASYPPLSTPPIKFRVAA